MDFRIAMILHKPYDEMIAGFLPNLLNYYKHPEEYTLEPFKIFGNLYYVGDRQVCCHLIDTGDGLILFDSGYAHTAHLLVRSIRKLGFDPADIKIIIHSHEHFDHFGASQRLKELYGCKVYMGKAGVERLKANPEAALMHLSPEPYGPIPETDVSIDDGDIITLGNTSIRCVNAPGHAEGVMAFFFDVTEGADTKRVGYWGGVGFLTIHRAHLIKYGLPLDMAKKLGATIQRLRGEYADVTIGNHPANNKTVERALYMHENPSENPFLDASVWEEQLDIMQVKLDDFIAKNY